MLGVERFLFVGYLGFGNGRLEVSHAGRGGGGGEGGRLEGGQCISGFAPLCNGVDVGYILRTTD